MLKIIRFLHFFGDLFVYLKYYSYLCTIKITIKTFIVMYIIIDNKTNISYKSKSNIKTDTISQLPYKFVDAKVIKQTEWANCRDKIVSRYPNRFKVAPIDGRSKAARRLPYFSWNILIEPFK